MNRYSVLPLSLYRCQTTKILEFRERLVQKALGDIDYDYQLGKNNLYNPIEGDTYTANNGIRLYPLGYVLGELLDDNQYQRIYELPKGLVIPPQFIVIHQNYDQYSLQTSVPVEPLKFHREATQFFESFSTVTHEEMIKKIWEDYNRREKESKQM